MVIGILPNPVIFLRGKAPRFPACFYRVFNFVERIAFLVYLPIMLTVKNMFLGSI